MVDCNYFCLAPLVEPRVFRVRWEKKNWLKKRARGHADAALVGGCRQNRPLPFLLLYNWPIIVVVMIGSLNTFNRDKGLYTQRLSFVLGVLVRTLYNVCKTVSLSSGLGDPSAYTHIHKYIFSSSSLMLGFAWPLFLYVFIDPRALAAMCKYFCTRLSGLG